METTTKTNVEPLTYDIPSAAARIGCGARWLAAECRAGRVEHAHLGASRRLTLAQIEMVIAKKTVKPSPTPRYIVPPSKRRSA